MSQILELPTMENMEYLIVAYGRSNWKPGSLAIQLRTMSLWSHVGGLDGEDIIEAVALKGVIRTPIADFKKRYSNVEFHKLPVASLEKTLAYLRSREGYKYDHKAILGFITLLGLDNLDEYHCAELIAGSAGYMHPEKLYRIVPGILRYLSVKLTAEELESYGLK